MSFVNVVLCFVPFLLIWYKRLFRVTTYLLLGIFWLANALENLPDILGQIHNVEFEHKITYFYNLLDAPLVLLLFFVSSTGVKKKIILYVLMFFVIFEPVLLIWKGHNLDSNTIVVGFDSIVGLIFSVWGLAGYFQKIEHSELEKAMGFAYAGFVFIYGVSIVTFVFSYLNYDILIRDANLFVYYLSMILGSMLTAYGLWRHGHRPLLSRS
jgi:hypothetical protein